MKRKIQLTFIWVLCLLFFNQIHAYVQDETKLTSNNIETIPPSGIVIDLPGTYVFSKDLRWDPNSDATAITIQANNVILDMQGKALKANSFSSKTTGIRAVGCSNLQILNGKIIDMGIYGIVCDQCANITIEDVTVNGLHVDDIINFTVPAGMLITDCIHAHIENCVVKNIDVQTASTSGIQFTKTVDSKATGCHIHHLFNRDGACSGIAHLNCFDSLIELCKIHHIKTQFVSNLNTTGHTAIGLLPFLSTGITLDQCNVSNITGCCDDAHGISLFVCSLSKVTQCKVSDVIDGVDESKKGAKATGIEIYASGVLVSDCSVKNITAINPEDKQATGFSCAACIGVEFLRCKATNVKVLDACGKHDASLGYGTGFGWAPDPRPEFVLPALDILYQDCVAKCCQVGFDSWFHINSNWNNIVSICNEIPILNLGDDAQRTISCGPCSECGCTQPGCWPVPYVVTITNVAADNTFTNVKIKNHRCHCNLPGLTPGCH